MHIAYKKIIIIKLYYGNGTLHDCLPSTIVTTLSNIPGYIHNAINSLAGSMCVSV